MTLREIVLKHVQANDHGPYLVGEPADLIKDLESLITSEKKAIAKEAIGEALWSFVVWNKLTHLSTPEEFKKQLDRILENQMSSSNLFPS